MSYERGARQTILRRRAEILARIRAFFAARGVLEVETPTLSTAGASDVHIDAIEARVGGTVHYLHTSPEHAMKRLLADGSGDIFQICRVYRDAELGRWHQPEFTLLEWYRIGYDEHALMDEVAELLACVLDPPRSVIRLSYRQAFMDALCIDPLAEPAALRERLPVRGVSVPDELDENALLDLAMSTVVVPSFAPDALTFVDGYPAAQAALAAIDADDPRIAARFELFSAGLELGNGFRELTDAAEQRGRFESDLGRRRLAGRATPPLDEAFLEALPRLPECAGVALGLDRVVALACGLDTIAQSMSFAHE